MVSNEEYCVGFILQTQGEVHQLRSTDVEHLCSLKHWLSLYTMQRGSFSFLYIRGRIDLKVVK